MQSHLQMISRLQCMLLCMLMGSFMLLGCSEELPIAPPVALPYTLFGVVNPQADTQAVIVYPVESGTLEPMGPEPLDAVVRSTDVETGEVRIWRDSVVSDGESGFSHIFWSAFRPVYGRAYRIDAVRSDGAEAAASVFVPRMIEVEESDDGTRRMRVTFRGAPFRLVQLEITYSVRAQHHGCPQAARTFRYTLPYAGREVRVDDGWELIVDLGEYIPIMEEFVREDTSCYFLFLDGLRLGLLDLALDLTVGDEAWEVPHGFLDRRILSHPGTLTNVEHGLGFIGAGYRYDMRLVPSAEAVADAGFFDEITRP